MILEEDVNLHLKFLERDIDLEDELEECEGEFERMKLLKCKNAKIKIKKN